jgi:shikimate dehydrogenase
VKLAVLGSPVANSLSPVMHRAALRHAGIDGDYVARDVDGSGFAAAVGDMRAGRLHGANVTMPHKPRAYETCEVRSELAEHVGAVNTLSLRHGKVAGDNTDVLGIKQAWKAAGLPEGGRVTIIGSGGAAAAALVALDGMQIQVVARRPKAADTIVQRVGVVAGVLPWGPPPPDTVVVNATPIGMQGESIEQEWLAQARGLLDMAYGLSVTPAVRLMRERGRPVAEGLDMLVRQAVASFEIWTGATIQPEVMRAAAERELARRATSKEP